MGINACYWDMNDQTRAWSKRYQDRHPKKMMPNHMQAGVYAAVLHYLKAVDKVGSPLDGARGCRGHEGDADRGSVCSAMVSSVPTAARSTQCTCCR